MEAARREETTICDGALKRVKEGGESMCDESFV